MPQPLLELGGPKGASLIHLAPANGFPPQTYMPMLASLTDHHRAICFPPRALWGDLAPPDEFRDWQMLADDLLRAFNQWDMREIVAVGHSFGGIASMLAAIKEPCRFRALVLLDPTILADEVLDWLKAAAEQNSLDQTPLVQGARRRRRIFGSMDEAFDRFRSRRQFVDWPDDVLRLYVQHGLRQRADADGFELTWPVEWEVYYYATIYQRIWQDLPKLEGLLPTLIARGGKSDTFTEASMERTCNMLPSATFCELTGQGHLFPQAAPAETGALIYSWLEETVA